MFITNPASYIVEPSSRIEFASTVDSVSAVVNVRWYSNKINVTDSTRFATPSTTQWLVARPGALDVGAIYTFTLIATDVLGRIGQANVTVLTNRPPVNGTFTNSPLLGFALQTVFRFSAQGWSDPDGDVLSFDFGFISSAKNAARIQLRSSTNATATSMLPLGANLSVSAFVIDAFGAATRRNSTATTLIPRGGVIDTVNSAIGASVASGDELMSLVASCTETLNVADDGGDVPNDTFTAMVASRRRLLGIALNVPSFETPLLRQRLCCTLRLSSY